MTLLHYALAGRGGVLGVEFENHLAEIPDELADLVLQNPLWRVATEEERAAREAAKTAVTKPARQKAAR